MQNKILGAQEISRFCRVSRLTVNRWISKGLLKAFRLPDGGHFRVEPEDLMTFLQTNGMPIPEDLKEIISQYIVIIEAQEALGQEMANLIKELTKGQVSINRTSNPYEACIAIGRLEPILVILDLDNKKLNAELLMEDLQGSKNLKNIPILAVHAKDEEPILKYKNVKKYSAAPFDVAAFKKIVKMLL